MPLRFVLYLPGGAYATVMPSRSPGTSSTLLASERAVGQRLLCVTEARSACRFQLAYDSKAGASLPVQGHAFVNAVERIAGDVMRLELELAEGCWFDFRPGQFIQVKVPGTDAMTRPIRSRPRRRTCRVSNC